MVVRTQEQIRPASLPTRVLGNVAATITHGLATLDFAERSRRNALAASVELSTAAAERTAVEAFLADYASARNGSPEEAS